MGKAVDILLLATIAAYLGLSIALGVTALTGREELKRKIAHGIWLGVSLHTMLLIARWIQKGHAPAISTFEILMLFSWILAALYATMQTIHKNYSLGMFVAPLAVLGLSFAVFTTNRASGLVPVLKSKWLYLHAGNGLLAYACFTLAAVAAAGYFLQEYFLKNKHRHIRLNLPPLEWLDTIGYRLVSMGFPLLTISIVTGAIWSKSANNMFWVWHPKQVWSLILWCVFGVYLHIRAVRGWRGRNTNVVLILGFLIMLFTFFGVNLLTNDQHAKFLNEHKAQQSRK